MKKVIVKSQIWLSTKLKVILYLTPNYTYTKPLANIKTKNMLFNIKTKKNRLTNLFIGIILIFSL
ncbi:hypothetical protein, partial [Cellulophaga sp. Z1A5H]|uniref:hypothetical protein n=1 Tax=Cellulophaga sp. Z1A5H TaxID=2687291 RepID=UPI00196B7DA1